MKSEVLIGAGIAALMFFLGSITTLFSENPDLSFSSMKDSTLVVLIAGTLSHFLKDFHAVWVRNFVNKVKPQTKGDES